MEMRFAPVMVVEHVGACRRAEGVTWSKALRSEATACTHVHISQWSSCGKEKYVWLLVVKMERYDMVSRQEETHRQTVKDSSINFYM